MSQFHFSVVVGLAAIFSIIMGLMLVAYEDGVSLSFYKKLRCKMGLHKRKVFSMKKYYCQFCKQPRKHPNLKAIEGGNKMGLNEFKG